MIKLLLTVVSLMLTDNFLYSDARPNNSQPAVVYDGDGLGEVDDVGGKNIDGANIAGTADAPVTHPATFSDNVPTQSFKKNVGERHFKKYEPTQAVTTVKESKDHAAAKAAAVKDKAKVKAAAVKAKSANTIQKAYRKYKFKKVVTRAQMIQERRVLNGLVKIVNGGCVYDSTLKQWVAAGKDEYIAKYKKNNKEIFSKYKELDVPIKGIRDLWKQELKGKHFFQLKAHSKAIEGFVKYTFPGDVKSRADRLSRGRKALCTSLSNSILCYQDANGNPKTKYAYFSNFSKEQQDILLNTMLSTYHDRNDMTQHEFVEVTNRFIALENDREHTAAIGSVLVDMMQSAIRTVEGGTITPRQGLEYVLTTLKDANRVEGDGAVGASMIRCGYGVDAKLVLDVVLNNAEDYNAKMSILAKMAEECIKLGDYKEINDFLKEVGNQQVVLHAGQLKAECKGAKEVYDLILKNNITAAASIIPSLRGEGLNVLLKSIDGMRQVKNPSDNILRLLGKERGEIVTFGDLQEYMKELEEKRWIALKFGHRDDYYDKFYIVLADEVSTQVSNEQVSIIETTKFYDAYNTSMEETSKIKREGKEIDTDEHTKLSSFLAVSMPLIKRGGGEDAGTFFAAALHTKDPYIIIHALSFLDDDSLNKLIDKYGEYAGRKNSQNLVEWIKNSLTWGSEADAEHCLTALTEELSLVKFHDSIDEKYMAKMIEDAKDENYDMHSSLDKEERNVVETARTQHKKRATPTEDK